MAISMAKELRDKTEPNEKLLTIHRKEADNDFLVTAVNELKDQVDVSFIFPLESANSIGILQ